MGTLQPLDWIVISIYFAALLWFAWYLGRGQRTAGSYYLADRKIPWWQSGFSTMATQLGAISFVSAPAFVAMKEGGGLKWLGYELGVPIGILIVMLFILPILHSRQYISIYEYLEERFDSGTRTLVSILFQLGRGLATAVTVLAGGLIISTAIPSLTTLEAILVIGAITVLYDMMGGIKVVIVSDFLQMMIIIVGIAVCGYAAFSLVGWHTTWATISPERLKILDFSNWGVVKGQDYGFWPLLFGGIFLYASYYGTDQSQVQRELSVGGVRDVRRSLILNAFGRFPVVLSYCLMGVFVGAVFLKPDTLSTIAHALGSDAASIQQALSKSPDRMVPMFILTFLPVGVVGFLFVAILSAMMSSLDSAINSLSAVTMRDFYKRFLKPEASDRHYLLISKFFTVMWGAFCVVAAALFAIAPDATRETTIVLINAVGSLLYGPILAAFLLGILTKRVQAGAVKLGVVAGITGNVLLWRFTPISWLWWNVAGFIVSWTVAYAASYVSVSEQAIARINEKLVLVPLRTHEGWKITDTLVVLYLFVIIGLSLLIQAA